MFYPLLAQTLRVSLSACSLSVSSKLIASRFLDSHKKSGTLDAFQMSGLSLEILSLQTSHWIRSCSSGRAYPPRIISSETIFRCKHGRDLALNFKALRKWDSKSTIFYRCANLRSFIRQMTYVSLSSQIHERALFAAVDMYEVVK